MNWYRIKYHHRGKELIAELEAHSVIDAVPCGLFKVGLHGANDYEISSVECIEEPPWSYAARLAAKQMIEEKTE